MNIENYFLYRERDSERNGNASSAFLLSIKLLAIFFILSAFIAGCSSKPKLSILSTNDKIVAFGDSITFGTGAGPGESYPDVLEEIIQRRVINAGVPGEVTNDGLKRLESVIKMHAPSLIIICHGGNDLLGKGNTMAARENIVSMVETALRYDIDAVLVGVPVPRLILKDAKLYEDIADSFSIPYAKDVLSEILSDSSLKADRIHPNHKGYKVLAG